MIKKNNSKNVFTQKYDFERRLCAQTQDLQIFQKFDMTQINPLELIRGEITKIKLWKGMVFYTSSK